MGKIWKAYSCNLQIRLVKYEQGNFKGSVNATYNKNEPYYSHQP